MDIEKAIEFLESIKWDGEDAVTKALTAHELVNLLKHGDRHVKLAHKLKKMWREIQDEILSDEYESVYGMPTRRGSIYKRYKIIQKKYFPEGLKK